MRIGVTFPQAEIAADRGAVKEYAQTVEALGFRHIAVYDHVLGANPASRPGQRFFYNHESLFHEPMVLFGYLAALTSTVELVTKIIILPQRQTVLAAKQAAAVDVLSGGRLRFGVGLGWNAVEYEALNENFHNRGRRLEEQVAVLRALWTEPLVTYQGAFHTITDAGINPLPIQRPIPIWIGGGAVDASLGRIARLGDGWYPQVAAAKAKEAVERMHLLVRAAGRDVASFGIEGSVNLNVGGPQEWAAAVELWSAAGATHCAFTTLNAGLATPAAHLDAVRRFSEVVNVHAD
jgi:probable F420-dependent oxidoreductase